MNNFSTDEIVLSDYENSVTSDSRPVPGGVKNVQSRETGLVTNATGARSDLAKFYEEEYALHEESAESDIAIYSERAQTTMSEAVANFILESWSPPSRPRILDFGCGKGLLLEQLGDRLPDAELTGIEPNKRARTRIAENPRLKRLNLTGLDTALANSETFDLVVTNGVLEHVEDPGVTLGDLRRLVTSNGHLFVGVPNFEANPLDLLTYDHLSRFTPTTLTYLLEQNGFEPLNVRADSTQVAMWWMSRCDGRSARPLDKQVIARELEVAQRHQTWLDSAFSAIGAAVKEARAGSRPIIVYGTANLWTAMIGLGLVDETDATLIVDDNASLWGTERTGGRVESPDVTLKAELGRALVIISANPCYFDRIKARILELAGHRVEILPDGQTT